MKNYIVKKIQEMEARTRADGSTWKNQKVVLTDMEFAQQESNIVVTVNEHEANHLQLQEGQYIRAELRPNSFEYQGKWINDFVFLKIEMAKPF